MGTSTADAPSLADAFSHGYLISSDPTLFPDTAAAWPRTTCGPITVALHPKTISLAHTTGRATALLIGHPVDLDADTIDLAHITRRAAEELHHGGVGAFTRYVGYLAGRFTAYAVTADEVVAVPDSCATQSVYWARKGAPVLASHIELVADAVGAQVNEAALGRLRNLRTLRPGVTHFFAGIETVYHDVLPLLANHRLRWDVATGAVRHERFYPFEDVPQSGDADAVYADFRDVFRQGCRLLSSFGRTGISLTGGDDSGTTLRGARPFLRDDAFTFTYLNPGSRSPGQYDDVFAANRLSAEAGLQHLVIRSGSAEPGSLFDQVFGTTWKAHRPSEVAARAMYEQLPRGFFQLQSMHAEVGTSFYRKRTTAPPTAARLAELYQNAAVAAVPEFVERFEEFIEYADFRTGSHANLDYHDLFYWEHRDSRWAAQKPHEGDLGHRVLQPFNSRRLIEVMFRLPYRQREEKVLLRRFHESEPLARRSLLSVGG